MLHQNQEELQLLPESNDLQKDGKWNRNTETSVKRKDSASLLTIDHFGRFEEIFFLLL